jgi:NAD(P)-dependent dehydrogenase (short-subunit alcohol dehydrogenase family)
MSRQQCRHHPDGAFHKMTLEQWNAVINTNLGSLFNMTRQVIEGMRARKFGRVVNLGSINGQKGQFGQVNYSPPPRPATSASPRRWRWRTPRAASPST